MKRVKRMREMDLCCKRNNQSFFLFLFFIAKQNQGWCDFISSLFIQSSICFIRFGWHVVSKEERYKTSYRRIKWWRREVKLSLPSIQALNLSYCLSFLCVVFFLSIHSPDCQSKIQHHLFSLILLLHYCLEVVVVARFVCVCDTFCWNSFSWTRKCVYVFVIEVPSFLSKNPRVTPSV